MIRHSSKLTHASFSCSHLSSVQTTFSHPNNAHNATVSTTSNTPIQLINRPVPMSIRCVASDTEQSKALHPFSWELGPHTTCESNHCHLVAIKRPFQSSQLHHQLNSLPTRSQHLEPGPFEASTHVRTTAPRHTPPHYSIPYPRSAMLYRTSLVQVLSVLTYSCGCQIGGTGYGGGLGAQDYCVR